MKEQFSSGSLTALAFFDQELSCWRMSQESLISEDHQSLELLPAWGMTQDGALYGLPMSERHTSDKDGFALLVTPQASENVRGRPKRFEERVQKAKKEYRYDLADQIVYIAILNGGDMSLLLNDGKAFWEGRLPDPAQTSMTD